MVSAALWASPRSDSPKWWSSAADDKAFSHLFHRLSLPVVLQYVNRWVLESMRYWAPAETKRLRTFFDLASKDSRQMTPQWMKLKTFADVRRAKSEFKRTHPSYKSGRSRVVILASTPELLAKGARKLMVYKGEHTIEPIKQFNLQI